MGSSGGVAKRSDIVAKGGRYDVQQDKWTQTQFSPKGDAFWGLHAKVSLRRPR